jgi:hypothetical protein
MKIDIQQRTVIIVRSSRNGELGPAAEYLPQSNLPWSYDGQPAPWRKMRG